MKRYMLISVIENRIGVKRFDTHEEAYEEMLNRLCANSEFEREDCTEEEYVGDDVGYDAYNAYVFDGKNRDNYSWQIIDLFDEQSDEDLID